MKKFILLFALFTATIFWASVCVSCAREKSEDQSEIPSDPDSLNNTTSANTTATHFREESDILSLPLIEQPSDNDLDEEAVRFDQIISRVVSAKSIDKVELLSGRMSVYCLESSDPSIIKGWCELLEKMEVVAVPLEPTGGTIGYSLSLYIQGEPVKIGGGFTDRHIYVDSNKVMFRIENYSDLQEKFSYLEKAMGFPKPE